MRVEVLQGGMRVQDVLLSAAAALEEGRRYEARERERRIGAAYILSGVMFLVVFPVYAALFALPAGTVPWWAWAFAWAPFVVVAEVVRRRMFRHLPTRVEDVTRLPSEWGYVFGALWMLVPAALVELGARPWAIPAMGFVLAAVYATQAWRQRDRVHAGLTLFVVLASLVAALAWRDATSQLLAMGALLGGSLVLVGLLRRRRA